MKVILAEDHGIVREGLRALLKEHSDVEVVAETDNGRDAVRLCSELLPDLVIMDVAMPDLNGIEATRQIRAECPQTKVIGLSMHSSKRFVIDMIEMGAVGYVLKKSVFDELAQAISAVKDNQVYLSPAIAGVVVERILDLKSRRKAQAKTALTPREREVLQLLAEGKTSRDVAQRLHLSVKTVDTHRRNIMEKLDIRTIPELTKYAIREGLTTSEH